MTSVRHHNAWTLEGPDTPPAGAHLRSGLNDPIAGRALPAYDQPRAAVPPQAELPLGFLDLPCCFGGVEAIVAMLAHDGFHFDDLGTFRALFGHLFESGWTRADSARHH
jgi:hypothetical protein